MTTIVIDEKTEEGHSLINVIRTMQKSSDAVNIYDDQTDAFLDSLPFERIPGLPHTDEECIASVRQAEEDIRAGRTVSMEEMRAKHPRV